MLHHLLESGVYNATFWFILAVLMALILRWRPGRHRIAFGAVIVLLMCGTAANLALSLYRGYTVPRDVLQDIVSAQEYLANRPLYPDDMTQRINDAIVREGPRKSLLESWPALHERERNQFNEMLTSHWVQAHPPFMTLFTAPFVKFFGILGTQIAFLLIALLSLGVTLYLIRLELFPRLPAWAIAIAATALLGWDPLLTVLRSGQTGLMLGSLLTASWFLLRRGRPGWAGVAAGMAISVKVVPALILVVLLIKQRRAFAVATLTVLTIGLSVLALTSVQDHLDYVRTSRGVVEMYAAYSGNLSLLGAMARGLRNLDTQLPLARDLWLLCTGAIVAAFAFQLKRQPGPLAGKTQFDLPFALAMTLMPFLSPVAWDHYLVYLILPLSVLASRIATDGGRRQWLGLTALALFFAIPDTTFHWLYALCDAADLHGLGNWFVLDLRLVGLSVLTIWLARRLGQVTLEKPLEMAVATSPGRHREQPAFQAVESGRI